MSSSKDEEGNEAALIETLYEEGDEVLPPVDAIAKYAFCTNTKKRLVYIQSIPSAAAEAEYSSCQNVLLPLVEQLLQSHDADIKTTMYELVVEFVDTMAYKQPIATPEVVRTLLASMQQAMCQLADEELLSSIAMAYVELVARLPGENERLKYIEVAFQDLQGQQSSVADADNASIAILRALAIAVALVPNYNSSMIAHFKQLASSKSFHVREEAASHVGTLARSLPVEVVEQELTTLWLSFHKDTIWSVRRACLSGLPYLLPKINKAGARRALMSAFETMTRDRSAWVKNAALHHIGVVIGSLTDPDEVPAQLLQRMVEMASIRLSSLNNGLNRPQPEDNLAAACARQLVMVARVLGKQRWPELQQVVGRLAVSQDAPTLRTFVSVLPGLAEVLGPDITAAHLLPSMERILTHKLEDVQAGLAPVFSSWMRALPPTVHVPCLEALRKLVNTPGDNGSFPPNGNNANGGNANGSNGNGSNANGSNTSGAICGSYVYNWRLRLAVAQQLGAVAAVLSAPNASLLVPAALALCRDPAAAVRSAASSQLGDVLLCIQQHLPHPSAESAYNTVIEGLLAMANSESHQSRQAFVLVVTNMMLLPELSHVVALTASRLQILANDKVTGVRYTLALALRELINIRNGRCAPEIRGLLASLQNGEDMYVARVVEGLKVQVQG